MIPFTDLRHVVDLVRYQAVDAFRDILNRHEFIGAETVTKLEAELCRQLGAAHAVACGSGTDALVLALAAYGIGQGDRVAVPNLTFWATYEAVIQCGAEAVMVDADPDDLQPSFDGIRKAHSRRRLKAVVTAHLFGWCSAQLGALRRWCVGEGILLVEDAAQAFGVTLEVDGQQRSVFAGAHVATLSFHPAKVIGGVGGGGAVFTRSELAAQRVRELANHGRTGHYAHASVGWNSRMSGIEAAYLLLMLDFSQEIIGWRRLLLQKYAVRLKSLTRRRLIVLPENVVGNGYTAATIGLDSSGFVKQALLLKGVTCGQIYPQTVMAQKGWIAPATVRMPEKDELCHVSRDFCSTVVNLPLYYGMTDAQLDQVVEALQAWEAALR